MFFEGTRSISSNMKIGRIWDIMGYPKIWYGSCLHVHRKYHYPIFWGGVNYLSESIISQNSFQGNYINTFCCPLKESTCLYLNAVSSFWRQLWPCPVIQRYYRFLKCGGLSPSFLYFHKLICLRFIVSLFSWWTVISDCYQDSCLEEALSFQQLCLRSLAEQPGDQAWKNCCRKSRDKVWWGLGPSANRLCDTDKGNPQSSERRLPYKLNECQRPAFGPLRDPGSG